MISKVITVTSGKGGVGKTTSTANLGTALAKDGMKTLVIDTDIGLRNLDVVMGLENRVVYDVVDIIEGRCKPKQAMIKSRTLDNLFLIPAAQTRDKDSITPEQMKQLVLELKKDFDFIYKYSIIFNTLFVFLNSFYVIRYFIVNGVFL